MFFQATRPVNKLVEKFYLSRHKTPMIAAGVMVSLLPGSEEIVRQLKTDNPRRLLSSTSAFSVTEIQSAQLTSSSIKNKRKNMNIPDHE